MDVQTILANLQPPSAYGVSPGWNSKLANASFKKGMDDLWSWVCFDPDIIFHSDFQTNGFKRLKDAVQYLEQVRQMHKKFEAINDLKPNPAVYVDHQNNIKLTQKEDKWQIGICGEIKHVVHKSAVLGYGNPQGLFESKLAAVAAFLDASNGQKQFCFGF